VSKVILKWCKYGFQTFQRCRSAVSALWIPFNQHGFDEAMLLQARKANAFHRARATNAAIVFLHMAEVGRAFAVSGQIRIHRNPCLRSHAL
jgi:hypothetical protein